MSKFVKSIKGKLAKRVVHISLSGDFIEIKVPSLTQKRKLKDLIEDLVIKIDDISIYDMKVYPNDFDMKLNDIFYPNQHISEIYDKSLKIGDKLEFIVPNRASIIEGNHDVIIETHSAGTKAKFDLYISPFNKKMVKSKIQPKKEVLRQCSYCGKVTTDPDQLICEDCGSELS